MENNSVASVDSSVVVSNEALPSLKKKLRGFAAMDRSKVSAISSMGGKAAWAKGTAHKFNAETAKAAGKLGGVAPHVSRGRVRVEVSFEEVDSSVETQV